MSSDHRKLAVFRLADALTVDTYRSTANFPRIETYGLLSQIRRAAVSIPTNLVEGCAKDSNREFARFLSISLGSTRELIYLLDLSVRLGLLEEAAARPLLELGNRIAAALTALKRSIVP